MRAPLTFDVTDRKGRVRVGVLVEARALGADGTVALTPAPAFVSEQGAAAANPIPTDVDGQATLWVEAGLYAWRVIDGEQMTAWEPVTAASREEPFEELRANADEDGFEVLLASRWGIDAQGVAYWDSDGATPGEEAWPSLDEDGVLMLTTLENGTP